MDVFGRAGGGDNSVSSDKGGLRVRPRVGELLRTLAPPTLSSTFAEEPSPRDSFASASEGEEEEEVVPRPSTLPRLQESYIDSEDRVSVLQRLKKGYADSGRAGVMEQLHSWKEELGDLVDAVADGQPLRRQQAPQTCRPSFLPPMKDRGDATSENPTGAGTDGAEVEPSMGTAVAAELLEWLPGASGHRHGDVARVAAWLMQLLRWEGVEELREEALLALGLLFEGPGQKALERVFTEACEVPERVSDETCEGELGLASELPPLAAAARQRLKDSGHQRTILCLFALVAACDGAARAALRASASGAVAAARRHPDDPIVRFWARSLVAALGSGGDCGSAGGG